jgi:RNA polymerase primary sigma factor
VYEIELSSDRREDASLQHYLQTIGKYKLLTKEQEFELARKIRDGDKDALDHLVNANLRFVVSVAKKFLNQGLSYMDLIAEGNIGLITAGKRFDERREFRFISYAVWWIRQAIQKAIAEQTNTVRLPINRTQQAHKMKKTRRRLEQEMHRPARDEEVADELGLTLRKMNQIFNASRPLTSLDESVFDDESVSLAETLSNPEEQTPEEFLLTGEMLVEMRSALDKLTPRESSIIVRYYGLGDDEPASLETIGQDINLSRERVRQIRNQALGKIRHTVTGGRLIDYLN